MADRVACLRTGRLAGLLALIGGVTHALDPLFPSGANLLNMANLIGLSGISSIGQGLAIITRGMGRPVGAMFALLGVVFVDLLANHDAPWPLAVATGGLALGAVHGPLGTRFRLQPFVVTLCGLLACRGASRCYTGNNTPGFGYGGTFGTLGWLAGEAGACPTRS